MLLGLFLLLLVALLLINFSVEFEFTSRGLRFQPSIKFGVGSGRYLISLPPPILAKMERMVQNRDFSSLEANLRSLATALRLMDDFLQKIQLFHLEVLIGLGDPMWTSLGYGGLWASLSPFITGLDTGNRLQTTPTVVIKPAYDQTIFQVSFHCIFQFRLGQIMINELKRVGYAWLA